MKVRKALSEYRLDVRGEELALLGIAHLESEADRLEAAAVADDLVTKLATLQIEGEADWWRSIDFDRNASRTYESMTGDSQQSVRTGIEKVLAHLTAAGRLVPAGGMALTAERIAELIKHAPAPNEGDYNDGYVAALTDLRDELFPATESAEEETKADPFQALHDVISFSSMDFGSASDVAWMYGIVVGWDNDDPDEGEHPHAAMWELAQRFNWPLQKVKELRSLRAEWVRRTSSPVVPAPTETGPWEDITKAPKHLTLRDNVGDLWTHDGDSWVNPETAPLTVTYINDCLSPFVAIKGGEA